MEKFAALKFIVLFRCQRFVLSLKAFQKNETHKLKTGGL